ncbi:ABC transporter permease [bacterium]|nr:ABC transporter permease [bacterium]
MFAEMARLSISNMLRARARLMMTAGGVVVGTTAVILLIALTIGLQRAAEAGIGSSTSLTEIVVYPSFRGFFPVANSPDSEQDDDPAPQLDLMTVQAMWGIPGVQAVIPSVYLQGGEMQAGIYRGYTQVIGVDESLLPYLGVTLAEGRLSLAPGEALVGAFAGEFFSDPDAEEFIPVSVNLFETPPTLLLYNYSGTSTRPREVEMNVVGRLAEGSSYDYAVIMPIEDVIALNEWITGREFDPETFTFEQVTVRATSRDTVQSVSDVIRELGFNAAGIGDFLNELNSFFGTMRVMLGGVGAVALLVAAFGVANTMTMAVLERTREIGLMKAIGATDNNVLSIFLIESGLVGMVGGAAGVTLSLVLQRLINEAIANAPQDGAGINFLPLDPSQIGDQLIIIPPELGLLAVTLATLVGLGAGFFPALRAARLSPVIALKTD